MRTSPRRPEPAGYRLRVAGHLDHHWSASFGDLTLIHEEDGTTTLTGAVSDQAQLHGLLTRIRDLGLTLISVTGLDPPNSVDDQPDSLRSHAGVGADGTPAGSDSR
jgi:hypothetical protein